MDLRRKHSFPSPIFKKIIMWRWWRRRRKFFALSFVFQEVFIHCERFLMLRSSRMSYEVVLDLILMVQRRLDNKFVCHAIFWLIMSQTRITELLPFFLTYEFRNQFGIRSLYFTLIPTNTWLRRNNFKFSIWNFWFNGFLMNISGKVSLLLVSYQYIV